MSDENNPTEAQTAPPEEAAASLASAPSPAVPTSAELDAAVRRESGRRTRRSYWARTRNYADNGAKSPHTLCRIRLGTPRMG